MPSTGLVVVLAVAVAISLLRGLFPRLPLPGPLLELSCGIALGPTLLNLIEVDPLLSAVAVLGMAFLLFLAGYEVDVRSLLGRAGRPARLGVVLSVCAAPVAVWGLWLAGWSLAAAGLVACALLATSVGLVGPVLRDTGLLHQPVGRLTLAGAALGEVAAIVAISIGFSAGRGPLGAAAVLAIVIGIGALTAWGFALAASSRRIRDAVRTQAEGGGQLRVRVAVLAVTAFAWLAATLGLEAVLGAFLAGGLARWVDPEPELTHPGFVAKLDGIGFGLLIPVFFVTSGLRLDLRPILADPHALQTVPVVLVLLLVVRGAAALPLRRTLDRRGQFAAALLFATSLPFLLVAAEIGESAGVVGRAQVGALVLAGLLSVVLLPTIAVVLLRRPVTSG